MIKVLPFFGKHFFICQKVPALLDISSMRAYYKNVYAVGKEGVYRV